MKKWTSAASSSIASFNVMEKMVRLENSAGTDGPKLTPCAVQRKVVNSEKVQWWTEVSSCDVRLLIYDP